MVTIIQTAIFLMVHEYRMDDGLMTGSKDDRRKKKIELVGGGKRKEEQRWMRRTGSHPDIGMR